MIRVFPRQTKWTPIDDFSFIGDPPLFLPPAQSVKISVTFTWDIPEAERLFRAWSDYYSDIEIGGPAFGDRGGEFRPGVFLKKGITITSRGCSKSCEWCLVPKREGWLRELPICPGFDIADNNLLACSKDHIESVFEMLKTQPEPIKFSGGLDAELLRVWHVDLLKYIRLKYAWFACDYPGAISNLERVADLMSDFSREKLRCYVLIGFNGENLMKAEKRLETVYNLGFLPMAMLFRPDSLSKLRDSEWASLQRKWSRPAAYKKYMSGHKDGTGELFPN